MKKNTKYMVLGIVFLLIVGIGVFIRKEPSQKREAKKILGTYLQTHYQDLDYEGSLIYQKKENRYVFNVDVKESEDKDFFITISSDGKITDSYVFQVEQKGNIASRVQKYLNQLASDMKCKDLFGENYRFLHLRVNPEDWMKNLPAYDESIESILKAHPVDCTVYVKDSTLYTQEEMDELKERIRKQLTIPIQGIEIE